MSELSTGAELGALATLRRGAKHSPELTAGIRTTLLLAILASVGQVVVPIAVQQTAGLPPTLSPSRASDYTAFFNLERSGDPGRLVEVDETVKIFSNPAKKATEDYVSGRFG